MEFRMSSIEINAMILFIFRIAKGLSKDRAKIHLISSKKGALGRFLE